MDLRLSEMDTTVQLEALAAGKLDLGFVGLGLPRETSDLQLALVAEEKLVAVLPEDHFLAVAARPIRLRALAGERFLLASRQNAPIYNPWVITLCQQAGFQLHDVQESGQPVTVINYVAAGLGVTILPAQFSRAPTDGVRFVPLASPAPKYRYYAAWSPRNEQPALTQFVALAREIGLSRTK
jgi:DNA-binding transcriptional LysR family regulator